MGQSDRQQVHTPPLRGVVFDMDGTLTESNLDFALIRRECGIPSGTPILEHLEEAGAAERERMMGILDAHESRAARQCVLRDGAHQTVQEIGRRGLRTALLTRNSRESMRTVIERFGLRFDCCLSREDGVPKPSPEPVLRIARTLGLAPEELLVVGDYVFDVQSGRAAGARTAFIRTGAHADVPSEADYVIDDLRELLALLDGARETD